MSRHPFIKPIACTVVNIYPTLLDRRGVPREVVRLAEQLAQSTPGTRWVALPDAADPATAPMCAWLIGLGIAPGSTVLLTSEMP